MSWRDRAAGVIYRVIGNTDPRKLDAKAMKDLRRKIRAAYPFGPRTGYPYKIWCDEVARALFKKKRPKPRDPSDRDQLMFDF